MLICALNAAKKGFFVVINRGKGRIFDQNLASSLLEKLHFCVAKIENIFIFWLFLLVILAFSSQSFLLVSLLLRIGLLRLLLMLIFICIRFLRFLFLDLIIGEEIVSYVFCDEKVLLLFLFLFRFLRFVRHVVLVWRKSHLRMTRWRENFFRLCLFGELFWEDFAFNICVGSYITDGQRNTLVHLLCIQIVSLDFFLNLSWHELDWVRIRQMLLRVVFRWLFQVALIIHQMLIVDDNRRQIFGQFNLEICIASALSDWSHRSRCKGISCNVDRVHGASHRDKPHIVLVFDHVKREVEFLQLGEIFEWVQEFRMEGEEFVPRKIESF